MIQGGFHYIFYFVIDLTTLMTCARALNYTGSPRRIRINRHIQPSEPVSLERSDYEEQQENSEKQNKEKDGILE